jgi:pantoate--beta-alanine ligase
VSTVEESSMQTVPDIAGTRAAVSAARRDGTRIGFVPTMGALHAGHLTLVERARRECGFVVVSIFVNPTQFAPTEDLSQYPRPRAADLAACEAAGVDLVFEPTPAVLYPAGFDTFVEVDRLSRPWEGAHRPTHFRGVTTVVLKLLNVVGPDAAYFGRKDYQQQLLVRRMCRDLDLPVEIVTCDTVREPDGLALSSRNVYLAPEERETALALIRGLRDAERRLRAGERDVAAVRRDLREQLDSTPGLGVDYATIVEGETLEELDAPRPSMVALVAARVGRTRLIDNVTIDLAVPMPDGAPVPEHG